MVSLRRVYDALQGMNPAEIPINQDMLTYVKKSRSQYEIAKSRAKENENTAQKRAHEKKKVTEEIKTLNAKRHKLDSEKSRELANIDAEIFSLRAKLDNF